MVVFWIIVVLLILGIISLAFQYWYISLILLAALAISFYFFAKTDKYAAWKQKREIKKRTDKIFDMYRSTRHVIDEDRKFFEENTGTTLEDKLTDVEAFEKNEAARKEQEKAKVDVQASNTDSQVNNTVDQPSFKERWNSIRSSHDLSMDGISNTWKITGKRKEYSCSDLLSYDLKENDSSIIGGGFSTGGFVGGDVGNGVAGMTGGYSGSRKVKHTVSRIELFINVRNSRKNTEIITIYKGKPLDVTSHVYRSYYKQAQSDISILDDIASRSKQ